MRPHASGSHVLVGGHDPDEIYREKKKKVAEQRAREEKESQTHQRNPTTTGGREGKERPGKHPAKPPIKGPFAIEEDPDRFFIQGFEFKGLEYCVSIAKTPIIPHPSAPPDYFEKLTRTALAMAQYDEDGAPSAAPTFYIGTAPFYIHLFNQLGSMNDGFGTAFKKDPPSLIHHMMMETLRNLRGSLQANLTRDYCHTLTRVQYTRSSGDNVTHRIGNPGEYTTPAEIQGVHIELSRLLPSRARPVCRWLFESSPHEPQGAARWLSDQGTGGTFFISGLGGLPTQNDEITTPLTMRLLQNYQLWMNLDKDSLGIGIGVRILDPNGREVLL